ncbi:plexin domain-containing protein 1-like isoform X1 [Nerophis ophidion]|uniref:plexin domain-containing protein 1-like isoform X1 n=2 Tax=Nerophis ophidion TaxID=159077 RepID=UPI002ADFC225|nr:plexin domain-containing protein 1-like isoform X1 [Nerophis ophidion]
MSLLVVMTIVLCIAQKPLAQRSPEKRYTVTSEDSTGGEQAHRWSLGHVRTGRAVQGGELFIDTLKDNMTTVVEDPGKYYTWRRFGPEDQRTRELWVDMSDLGHGQVRVHGILSNAYQQATKIALSFDFPFYGHYLRQITIATGGFIFTGELTHRMLTSTQYIAPLMAHFDPSHSKESTVQYLDNGEVFVVQWDRVRLSGQESVGAFTFQAALYKTGTITFSYKDIPVPPKEIGPAKHPVKAGLSDAFVVISSSQSSVVQKQRVYEYHRIDIDASNITSLSAVQFTPLPTCLQHDNCERCVSSNQTSGCSWCNVLQRCSDGMDRHRQEWLDFSCLDESIGTTCDEYNGDNTSVTPETQDVTATTPQNGCKRVDEKLESTTGSSDGWANTGVLAGVASALVLLLALMLVALYIHCHPTAAYFVQRHRSYWPSWKFQKKQPGYTEVEEDGQERSSIVQDGP